ncbi:MAG TPA: hypothetical protein VNN72_08655 [Polyangiaceae bacterium]|nr:hypothetical protein [Polyangiaceae bacterium]
MAAGTTAFVTSILALAACVACGGSDDPGAAARPPPTPAPTNPQEGPAAGYPDGHASVPAEGREEDVSSPTTVVGTGTPESCTSDDFVDAVATGGVITFDCGSEPATIVLTKTAKVFNDRGTKLVIDGGNKITLSGGGRIRILYMATCDKAQVYPPGDGDCNTNPGVELVVQNITFVDGSAKGIADGSNNGGGGGAIHAQGGSLKVYNARFFNNVCDDLGSDVGGGAIRKLDYLVAPGAGPKRPVWVVNSTFGGGPGLGNSCANGGALSSIGVSWNILNSLFSENTAVGHGANDGDGGNGGAIYNDGNEIVMNLTSSLLENNVANEGGSAVFFVSNDRSGSITIKDSITRNNPRGTFETPDLPGFYVLAKQPADVVNSEISR